MKNIIKTCTKCKITQNIDNFTNSKRIKDGKQYSCKSCQKKYRDSKNIIKKEYDRIRRQQRRSEYYRKIERERANNLYRKLKEESPEKYKKYLKEKRLYRLKNKERYMLTACKRRAKYENIPFNIELSDIIIPEYCPILGIKLESDENIKNLNTPSLDKIIPELGYVKDNIRVVSRKANMMKLNATLEELKLFSKNILKYIEDYECKIKEKENN